MAKTNYLTVDEYHASVSGETASRLEQIRQIIHRAVPGVEETISYQIPCFKYLGYLIYYSAYSNHISISYPYSASFLEHFQEQLKKYKVSKSAIQIPHKTALPVEEIAAWIEFRKAENEANPPRKKK